MLKKSLALLLVAGAVSASPLCSYRTFASEAEARQSGCCSWHGGVCGCANGRKKCCDGSLSPSCQC